MNKRQKKMERMKKKSLYGKVSEMGYSNNRGCEKIKGDGNSAVALIFKRRAKGIPCLLPSSGKILGSFGRGTSMSAHRNEPFGLGHTTMASQFDCR